VIHLKDIVKGGIRERFAELRRMGIRTVMTLATIRRPSGRLRRRPASMISCSATPEDKLG